MGELIRDHESTLVSILMAFVTQAGLAVGGVLVARILGAENRGHFALIALAPLILSQLGALGLPQAATFYIARDPSSNAQVVRAALRMLKVSSGLLLLLHALVLLVLLRDQSTDVRAAGLLTLVATPGALAQTFGLAVLLGQQRFTAFNLLRILQLSLHACGMLVIFLSGSVSLVLVSSVWTASVVVAGTLILAVAVQWRSDEQTRREPPSGRDLLGYGLKGLPGNVSPLESFRIDQIIVGAIAGPAALGYYVVGAAFSNLPRFIAYSIGMIAAPRIATSRASMRSVLTFVALTTVASGGVAVLLAALVGELVPLFFGSEFGQATTVARVLLLAAFFFSLRRVLSDCARGLGHPEYATYGEIAASLVLLPLVWLMASEWAEVGAAASIAIVAALNTSIVGLLLLKAGGKAEKNVARLSAW